KSARAGVLTPDPIGIPIRPDPVLSPGRGGGGLGPAFGESILDTARSLAAGSFGAARVRDAGVVAVLPGAPARPKAVPARAAAVEASAALSRAYSHRQAETLASTDGLTGLPNRRYFDEFCGLLARRRRADDAVGALMIDIDRFKVLNDRFGHAVGDEVLRAV